MKKLTSLFVLLILVIFVAAQTEKRPLTPNDILKWNRITETQISNNGNYIIYKQEPWKGDPTLKITNAKGKELESIIGGTGVKITADSKFIVFTQNPLVDTVRTLKLKKTKKEDLPNDKLIIYNLSNNETETIEKIKSHKIPVEWAGWIAWQVEAAKDTTKKEKDSKPDSDKVYPLFIRNTNTGLTNEIPAVSSYIFAKEKEVIVFISEGKDSIFDSGIYVYNLNEKTELKITDVEGKFKQLAINKSGDKVAFLKNISEDKEKNPKYNLHLWNGEGIAKEIVNFENEAIPENWEISENGVLSFSDNNTRMFFGTAPIKIQKDTTVLEEEIPMLDIWTWNEEVLQTVQLNRKERDMKKSYLAVIHLNNNKTVQLETKNFTGVKKINNGDSEKLLAWSNRPYAVQSMWEGGPRHNDFYLVDINTGKAEIIKEDCRSTPEVSPNGSYLYWYNAIDTTWNTFNIKTGTEYKITTPNLIQVANELNDIPNLPRSYYHAGWLKNDAALLIYDRFNIWKIAPDNGKEPINITQNGERKRTSYRIIKFETKDNDKGIDPTEPLFLKGHNEITRADSYYELNLNKLKEPKELFAENKKLSTPKKAKNADVIVFTKEDFETYPNLIVTDLSFRKQQQISNAAPQQSEFIWGTAELVSWTSLDGIKLEGTLHKPANFDSSKKYPMIVNFYEKSSQGFLSYHMPELGRSTIGYHNYTSNGYIIFNPDVYYKEGYPGEDAFNCVMPGVTAMIAKGFVDEKHIGAQGHSWGGYQVAYLATRTNLFAAIESGAPVVNMFSAYGGIRWGSGMNRSFQYEHTQSRIGKSIWESPLRYMENSPLFTLDKINTPILIMHNDDDGAVPWYQGIEFFIGMRRLQKPAWLLNYNEADHWPTKLRDMEDFQIRMAQFFDHYLKDEPMPKWMKNGIPAVKKGI
ncbi:MAG: S9 family peptidase, partial [Draconibacterium sp.]|nr:S9 family peptidase [Draconibacterium sp.]